MRANYLTLLLLIGLTSVQTAGQSAPLRKDIPSIAKAAKASIVTIVMANNDDPIARGSGFLVSSDGMIVTNYHVIAEGNVAVVKFSDGTVLPVEGVLAADKVRDLAIIKIRGGSFRALALGNSDRIQIGEDVVAIGNPLGLELTVSNGILSGVRTVEKAGGKFLQITAPISHGSSGGPLFNTSGEVVGITSMYFEGGENLNFAIPINDAKRLLQNDLSHLRNLPNEEVTSKTHEDGAVGGGVCDFFVKKMTNTLPQAPTHCEQDPSTTREATISLFSSTPVLAGTFRRGWSTAVFQTLQAAALDGPCQKGCSVSVSDSQMASTAIQYSTYVSKESETNLKVMLQNLGGFRSDEAYLLEWNRLLDGTSIKYALTENNAKSLANHACQDYLNLLREDPLLADELHHSAKNFPSLPACSVLMTTESSLYIVLDFPNNFMTIFGNFADPLPRAFHSLGRYGGNVIIRGPWEISKDGSQSRVYKQYSLHWLGFIYDEMSSGVRSAPQSMVLLLTSQWPSQVGQSDPSSLSANAGTTVARDAAVYKISASGANSRIQLTDGSEWTASPYSLTHCSLSVGDVVGIFSIGSLHAGGQVSLTKKDHCELTASFAGAWPSPIGPNTKIAASLPDPSKATEAQVFDDTRYCYQNPNNNLQAPDGSLISCNQLVAAINMRVEQCKTGPESKSQECKTILKRHKEFLEGRL
jgi:S1-C subfamily serine protease